MEGAEQSRMGVSDAPIFEEAIIDPDLPIIDAHHHLWFIPAGAADKRLADDSISDRAFKLIFQRHGRYLFDEFRADAQGGHNIRASVFVECNTMNRTSGPEPLRSVGEVEFASGVAAMSESGLFGEARIAAAIVGGIDLRQGSAVEDVLNAHVQAAGGRYRGVRGRATAFDQDVEILGKTRNASPEVFRDPEFRAGFSCLERLGLSFDAWLLETQIDELIDLARAFPGTQIVLNHCGAPLGVGTYAGRRQERFPFWAGSIRNLADCPNVVVKLGGFGAFTGFNSFAANPPFTSKQLAEEWRPYIETCINAFGANRCMFESNFPVEASVCTYNVLWNAFKRIAIGASRNDRADLFSNTAARTYKILL